MKLNLLVVAGDGIGPEVTREAVSVMQTVASASGHEIAVTEKRIGGIAMDTDGIPLPADTLEAALASDAVFLGAVGGTKWNALPPNTRPEAGVPTEGRRSDGMRPRPQPAQVRSRRSRCRGRSWTHRVRCDPATEPKRRRDVLGAVPSVSDSLRLFPPRRRAFR